ncbi:MAG: FAD-dependent oxidoreductase [Hyphomicrobiaceae bacterium]
MQSLVIGAGIVGVNAAHALLDLGHQVTLVDPDGIAERTSRGNAGMIAHTDLSPLASPKVWRNLPGWLLDPLGPMSIRPAYAAKILPWMLRFVRASGPEQVEASTKALMALNGGALKAWERRLERLDLKAQHLRTNGYYYVFTSEKVRRSYLATAERQQQNGVPLEILDYGALKAREPALGPNCAGAAFYPTGATVSDPKWISDAVGQAALKRGAKLVTRAVQSIVATPGGVRVTLDGGGVLEADAAVIAAGVWSRELARQLGDQIPLDAERGYNITMPKGSLGITRTMIFEGAGIAASVFDGSDRVGGSVEFAGTELPPNYKRVDAIIGRLKRYVPEARTDVGERWMGMRPSLPDSLPVIARSKASPNIVYAFGHSHYGLTQSAVTGDLVAELVSQRKTSIDLMPFSADRF